ncbi:uncharacterized protein LOC124533107 [Vanessa cardui]|uniref:uncharacterized protein LOC124533107 n=1 Tax=Vanessa cardui TaxID=171605 RepID=UPI001F143E0F|nr:uncharacterized protein LOC124533107 [Vanessa cardui]
MADQLYPDTKVTQRITFSQRVREITQCFVSTSDVLRMLSSSESVALLLHLTIFTFDLTFTIYVLLQLLNLDGKFYEHKMREVLQIAWLFYHTIKIVLLVEPCYRTQEKVSSTRLLVARIMCYVTSEGDPLGDEIDDFVKQLALNNLSYSAMGICTIGRPVISTIIGSVTTILVFLYQL